MKARLSTLIPLSMLLLLACTLRPRQIFLPPGSALPPTSSLSPAPTAVPFNSARLGTVERDATYCTMDGLPLKMDIYYPESLSGSWPAVLYVHGGGWVGGNKSEGAGVVDRPALTAAGFLYIAINYRLAPAYKFPAMIQDVKCAVRYLRAHAIEYNLNPDRIGAIGGSAGGHLVSLLGLSDPSAGWEAGEYLDHSSRVQAVVDYFGPADLTDPSFGSLRAENRSVQVFGATDRNDPVLVAASPVTYATPDDPPFLIVQGQMDTTVPPSQSQILYAKLVATGIPAELMMVENAGHGFIPVGGAIRPTREEITRKVVEFFSEYLK